MSLHETGLNENSDSYVVQNRSGQILDDAVVKNELLYLTMTFPMVGRLATRQMQRLADFSNVSESDLFEHVYEIMHSTNSLDEPSTLNATQENLRGMLQNYAKE